MDNKRNSESLSRADTMEKETEAEVMLNKIRELKDLVESKDKQLRDERLNADIKLQKKMVVSHNLQTSLDEAQQERDEMAERLRRKEQEDMRRENDTDLQLEDLKNQLQAERMRSDTLQREHEDFRREVKEKNSRDLKQFRNLKMEKDSLDSIIASQDLKLKNKMVSSRNLQTSLDEAKQERDEMAQRLRRQDQEMVDMRRETNTNMQLEDLKKQLQAERLRADTLQKQQEEFRQERPPVGQERASRDLKQVQNLEVKGLSPEAKALQMKDLKIKELEELIAREQHQQKNNVMTRYLQTSLEEAKQERDEMAQRLMGKDQERFRRETNTTGQTENLDLDDRLPSSRGLQYYKIKELQRLVENKDNQLQAERLRADTLRKEHEDFRLEVQQKASRDLKQVQNLEEEKRSLNSLIASQDLKLKNKMVLSRNLQTSLDEAKQEREEMAQRLRRKDQELEYMRRETSTDVQLEDLKNQLQAERLRSDTLQREHEDFRREVKEKARRDLEEVQNLKMEKDSLEQEARGLQIKNGNRIQELHDLFESLRNQLQAERLRTDTLQKKQEELRREAQLKSSRDLKQVQNLEEEKRSLEQEMKALQEEVASSKNQLQTERLEVQDRLVDMENVSLWRRFKKAITPDSRRQYKHLRMQWQDQEENPSSSVPPIPPNMPRP
ncbi:trichohyalin-like [Notolabrus celidotus]|uniref:trichohyalin-like n=1 Tax=Notolabrus celidotus TaxID=1203425 RepID=UPI00148F6192|nr:trichohyalin-like [Notolabrus celidotus]